MRNELIGILNSINANPTDIKLKGILCDLLEENGDPRLDLVKFYIKIKEIRTKEGRYSFVGESPPECPEEYRCRKESPHSGFHFLGRLVSIVMFEKMNEFLDSYKKDYLNKLLCLWFMRNCLLINEYASNEEFIPFLVHDSYSYNQLYKTLFFKACKSSNFSGYIKIAETLNITSSYKWRSDSLEPERRYLISIFYKIIQELKKSCPWKACRDAIKEIKNKNLLIIGLNEIN